jgi:hypothetical protein
MSDFLTRLVQRQWGELPTVQPRIAPALSLPDALAADVAEDVASSWNEGEGSRRKWARALSGLDQPPLAQGEADPWVSDRWVPREKTVHSGETPPDQRSSADEANGANVSVQEFAEEPTDLAGHLRLLHPLAGLVEARAESPICDGIRPADRSLLQVQQHTTASLKPFSDTASSPASQIRSRSAARSFWERSEVSAPPSLLGSQALLERSRTAQVSSEPPVQVTIGRIEITALSAPPPARRASQPRKPSMSLQDYLAQRQGGKP